MLYNSHLSRQQVAKPKTHLWFICIRVATVLVIFRALVLAIYYLTYFVIDRLLKDRPVKNESVKLPILTTGIDASGQIFDKVPVYHSTCKRSVEQFGLDTGDYSFEAQIEKLMQQLCSVSLP